MKPLSSQARLSLTGRLLWVLLSSLSVVALALGAGGVLFIQGVAEQTTDRVLAASSRAIAETLAVENGQISLDLPPAALGLLENDERDNVYYSVRHDAESLTGYPDFPQAPADQIRPDGPSFRYANYRGATVRVATEARRLPRVAGLVVVQVAETLEQRHALARRMMIGLAALEAALVAIAGLLVWPTIAWGLRPLSRLQREINARPKESADFTPLDVELAPSELHALVTGFNALLGDLESAVSGMRRFTADASHQMRTPLAVLRTHLALVRRYGADSPEGQASLRDIEAASERLQRLLTQLIALARADETVASTQTVEVLDLTALAAEVAADMAPGALRREIEIRFEAEANALPVSGDPVLVGEIISNLVENAINYNEAGGEVRVAVTGRAGRVVLEVGDDGPGIAPDQREKVFQRFHRLPRDQGRAGSGLGLSIVRALARAMGAEVTLGDGASGKGLTVCVAFPLVEGAQLARKPVAHTAGPPHERPADRDQPWRGSVVSG